MLEIDGWATHGDRASSEHERCRRDALVQAGYRVVTFTWRQSVDDPAWVLTTIRALWVRDPGI